MAVKASPEIIRGMKRDITETVRDLERISVGIRSVLAAGTNWDDEQAVQFHNLMQQIARLTVTPVERLNEALPKMEKLAQSLDQYNKVKF